MNQAEARLLRAMARFVVRLMGCFYRGWCDDYEAITRALADVGAAEWHGNMRPRVGGAAWEQEQTA